MLDAVTTIGAGVVFGLALAAPPGPMNAIIAEEAVLRGWLAGLKAGLGAGLADFAFFVLAALGVVAFVQQFPTVQAVLFGVGGVLMLYFAYGAAQGAQSFTPARTDGEGSSTDGNRSRNDGDGPTHTDTPRVDEKSTGFRKAFVLALTNPYQILFWLTVGVGLLDPGTVDVLVRTPYVGESLAGLLVVETGSTALIVGFFGGIALWLVSFPAALVSAQRRVEALAPVVAVLSAVVLTGFGVVYLLEAARMLG